MQRFKKILVATDCRLEAQPIVAEAAELASRNQAALTIVSVVPDSSWIANLVTSDLESMRHAYIQETQSKLESLAATLKGRPIDVTTKVLVGKTSLEIIREVLREKHDLVMAVAKGKNSKRTGFFGYTAWHLLRNCPAATWLIPAERVTKTNHVLGCVDISDDESGDQSVDEELNNKVYELTESLGSSHEARQSILYAWRMADEALLSTRLSAKQVAEFVADHHETARRNFDRFLRNHNCSLTSEIAHLIKGRAPETIEKFVKENSVDLVVMGTVGRAGISGMLLGNTAEQTLDRLECAVLAIKPCDFQTSIKLKRNKA